ncbi:hypothetical protein [uncultured Chitinophaga sp.]|jgi:Predicted amino acid aldolase or racemase|uniref:hypothetical protein n=1 Tax=uncultured Chitinophaga sp. TaxID=339340 RepID=UPI00260ADCE9|nr:hypothetical protein [uncultured Chitinophaga sp.]
MKLRIKRILILAALILPQALQAQTKLTDALINEFSEKAAERFQLKNDPILVFITDQMSRSGAGGLEVDKTMVELKKDPAALDAALKYLYQYSDCNRQQLIANLRSMNFASNSVFALATYTVNKFKGEAKDLIEEKATLAKTGQIGATPTAPVVQAAPAATAPAAGNTISTGASTAAATTSATATTTAATPAQPAPAEDPYDWDVRNIFPITSQEQLVAKYGQENVVTRDVYDLEGNNLGQGYIIFPDTDNEMELFLDENKGKVITFTRENSKWKSPFGIKVGDPLEKIVKVNGRNFRLNGFEWVNSGMVYSWDGGAMDGKGVSLVFKAFNSGDPKLYDQVTGDKKVKTDQSVLKKLGVTVEKVSFKTTPPQP